MYILVNKNKINLKICSSFKDKLLGLMFKKNIKDSIYLKNTNSIHTFFMREAIDVIFVKDNKILKTIINVIPNKIILCKSADGVIELPKSTLSKDDKIKIFN